MITYTIKHLSYNSYKKQYLKTCNGIMKDARNIFIVMKKDKIIAWCYTHIEAVNYIRKLIRYDKKDVNVLFDVEGYKLKNINSMVVVD